MTLLFLCASSDSYGRRAELARTALFPTPCCWTTMRKFAMASKRKRISILLPKRCFRMGPMSLTSICNIMLLVGFFESSKSHLSSDRRDRSCSSVLWGAMMHRSYAIVTKRASSTLRKASVPHLCRGGHIARGKCSGWHTNRRLFRRTCHKPLFCKFNWQACCSAEGARYRSAIVCVFAMGKNRTSCGLPLQRVWKRESAHESHVGMMSLMSLI